MEIGRAAGGRHRSLSGLLGLGVSVRAALPRIPTRCPFSLTKPRLHIYELQTSTRSSPGNRNLLSVHPPPSATTVHLWGQVSRKGSPPNHTMWTVGECPHFTGPVPWPQSIGY